MIPLCVPYLNKAWEMNSQFCYYDECQRIALDRSLELSRRTTAIRDFMSTNTRIERICLLSHLLTELDPTIQSWLLSELYFNCIWRCETSVVPPHTVERLRSIPLAEFSDNHIAGACLCRAHLGDLTLVDDQQIQRLSIRVLAEMYGVLGGDYCVNMLRSLAESQKIHSGEFNAGSAKHMNQYRISLYLARNGVGDYRSVLQEYVVASEVKRWFALCALSNIGEKDAKCLLKSNIDRVNVDSEYRRREWSDVVRAVNDFLPSVPVPSFMHPDSPLACDWLLSLSDIL